MTKLLEMEQPVWWQVDNRLIVPTVLRNCTVSI